ncbi:hypothetical protein I4U23_005238 [Adineta vaga]|nr:hypothetical protein I4U23_005238 [Adineta vaga]
MSTDQSSANEDLVVRFNINGKPWRIQSRSSTSVADMRYELHLNDEESTNISQLLNKNNLIRFSNEVQPSISVRVPERKSKSHERKIDLECVEPINKVTKTSFQEQKASDSTQKMSEYKNILATDLDTDAWKKVYVNNGLFCGVRMDRDIPGRVLDPLFEIDPSDIFNPKFQINDDTYIQTFMNEKQYHSSFVSSTFFDSNSEFSDSFVSFGIDKEYFKDKSKIFTRRTEYSTCSYNIHRVTVQLDLSYLKLSSSFIKDIDTALSADARNEKIIKLTEVFKKYGHAYPRRVVLGGHLYQTGIHSVSNEAERETNRQKVEAAFKTLISKFIPSNIDYESANKLEIKNFEQTSLELFKAVGGDTRLAKYPEQWQQTVADPKLWRIIHQKDYQVIITLLDEERQRKFQEIFTHEPVECIYRYLAIFGQKPKILFCICAICVAAILLERKGVFPTYVTVPEGILPIISLPFSRFSDIFTHY